MLKTYTSVLLAAFALQAASAADEYVGRPLPVPSTETLTILKTQVAVVDGEARVELRVQPSSHATKITWLLAPFGWVSMDSEDRDPAFSELSVFGDAKPLLVSRSARALFKSKDITQKLISKKINIQKIMLGNIEDLPVSGAANITKADPSRAYFNDVDGTLFPAWQNEIKLQSIVPALTQNVSYKYKFRPAFFLVAGNDDALVHKISDHCALSASVRSNVIASLKGANLICLYRLPISFSHSAIQVDWKSRSETNDDYLCSEPSGDIMRMKDGLATMNQSDSREIRAFVITKDDHCE